MSHVLHGLLFCNRILLSLCSQWKLFYSAYSLSELYFCQYILLMAKCNIWHTFHSFILINYFHEHYICGPMLILIVMIYLYTEY